MGGRIKALEDGASRKGKKRKDAKRGKTVPAEGGAS